MFETVCGIMMFGLGCCLLIFNQQVARFQIRSIKRVLGLGEFVPGSTRAEVIVGGLLLITYGLLFAVHVVN